MSDGTEDAGEARPPGGPEGEMPKPKDKWDKLEVVASAVGALAVPILVLIGGYFLDRNAKDRANDIQNKVAIVQAQVAEQTKTYQSADIQIRRASLLRDLLPTLTASAPADRLRGYQFALWAAPDDAAPLLSNLYDLEQDQGVKQQLAPLFKQRHIIIREVVVLAAPAPTQPQMVEKLVETRSGPQSSGEGDKYAGPYNVCSTPPSAAATVVSYEFQLVGDRACNGWATCTPMPKGNQVCYQFTLQGHNEYRYTRIT